MKKFFSLIALVGVFAACQPEQIETAFKVAGAKLTVNVEVVDLDGNNYADATITSSAGTVSGRTITFEAAENEAIPAQNITVTASTPKLASKSTSVTVAVPEIIAGGVGTASARIVVGDKTEDYTYNIAPKGSPEQVLWDVKFLENPHYGTYEHAYKHNDVDITTWYLNDSEYILNGTVTYQMWYKTYVVASHANYPAFEPIVEAYAFAFDDVEYSLPDGELKFKVSGYGMWAAWQTVYLTMQTYEVIATKGSEKIVAGEFDVWAEDTHVAEEIELGMPTHLVGHGISDHTSYHTIYTHGHDSYGKPHVYEHTYSHDYQVTYPIYSHYIYGHGVAGGASNAGGGIVFSE